MMNGFALAATKPALTEPERTECVQRIDDLMMERSFNSIEDSINAQSRYMEALKLVLEEEQDHWQIFSRAEIGSLEERLSRAREAEIRSPANERRLEQELAEARRRWDSAPSKQLIDLLEARYQKAERYFEGLMQEYQPAFETMKRESAEIVKSCFIDRPLDKALLEMGCDPDYPSLYHCGYLE